MQPSPMPDGALFAYDASRQLLVMHAPDGSPNLIGIQVRALQAAGWNVSEEGLRQSLPRFGKILTVAPDMASAKAFAQSLNGLRN